MGNGDTGIETGYEAGGATIGSTDPTVKTVVSGNNRLGIHAHATIHGVLVGTDITGLKVMPNGAVGIFGNAAGCISKSDVGAASVFGTSTIGSSDPTVKTVVSSNVAFGCAFGILTYEPSTAIYGVLVGTDITVLNAMPNGEHGIVVDALSLNGQLLVLAPSATIGSIDPNVKTVVSGNGKNGIFLLGAPRCTVVGVFAGVGKDGSTAIGNGLHGIYIEPVAQNDLNRCKDEHPCITTIGAPSAPPSVISNNGGHGVYSETPKLRMHGAIYAGVALDGFIQRQHWGVHCGHRYVHHHLSRAQG
jgi:hypothetical protein